jgi:hypothetical protein
VPVGPKKQDIAFGNLDIGCLVKTLVVVVDGNRHGFFGVLLSNDIII